MTIVQSAIETFHDTAGELLAFVIRRNFRGEKYNFLTDNSSGMQVGVSNYSKGDEVKAHSHVEKEKMVRHAQECIVVQEGKMALFLFDRKQNFIAQTVLEAGDVTFQAAGGHAFKVLENTKIIEIKQGPFFGPQDKTTFPYVLP